MARRAVLWSSVLLAGALLGASAPWSRALPSCRDVPAAERERARLAGRCEGQAPIVNVLPNGRAVATARRPVPDLRGRPFNQRDERLARYIVAVDYRASAQRRDWVIDQVPRPPATLPEGGDLRVVLSDGALVRVPDVRGAFARALVTLHRAGLSWIAGDGPTGPVVGQVPAPGTPVKPGTQIVLRVAAPGALAFAPESTRPDVTPGTPPPTAPPPATAPAAPGAQTPAGSSAPPPTRTPPATPQATQPTPASTAMPDVQGLIFDAARERLAGFPVQRVHRAGTEPGGTVIGQSPPAGTAVTPGTPVRLVLSDGTLVRVPRVMSFTLGEARQRLAAGELRPVVTNLASDAPAGTVVSQQPAEGQIAQRGSAIRLGVSSGPSVAAAPAAPSLAVPNLVGSTYDRVRPQLDRFRVERSERAAREPVGTVLEQSPAPGTRVEPGSTVSIIVSSGGRPETIDVANVVGQGAEAATGALSEFRVERVAVPSTEPAGRVLGQEPAPGTAVAPGGTVRLRVSDGSRVPAPSFDRMTLAQARDAARAEGLSLTVSEGRDDPDARVRQQDPAPGTQVARGSTLTVTVENRLPFAVPSAARDAWARATEFVRARSARDAAIAVVVLLALFALLALLLARRRPRERIVVTEPIFTSTRVPGAERPLAERLARAEPPGSATTRSELPVTAPLPPIQAIPRRAEWAPPPVVGRPAESEPPVFGAAARLEADPAETLAPTAAPRGPEIRIAAWLEPGESAVRELPAETAPDELTEESK